MYRLLPAVLHIHAGQLSKTKRLLDFDILYAIKTGYLIRTSFPSIESLAL